MLLAIVTQFDAPTRHEYPRVHRWMGRLYVISGLGAIGSLRWLREFSGAGSSAHGDLLMHGFVDAASLAWIVATSFAVHAIVWRRDKEKHSRFMLVSAGLAGLPILQRLLNGLVLCPWLAALRCLICLFRWQAPPWRARWGPPQGALSLLLDEAISGPELLSFAADGAGNSLESVTNGAMLKGARARDKKIDVPAVSMLIPSWQSPVPMPSTRIADATRASPLVFSFDGYGEAEQTAFGLSAWLALCVVLGGAWAMVYSEKQSSKRPSRWTAGAQDANVDHDDRGSDSQEQEEHQHLNAATGTTGLSDAGISNLSLALTSLAPLAPWRRLAEAALNYFCSCRRIAGAIGHVLCRRFGSRHAARMVAVLAWPLSVALPPVAACGAIGLIAILAANFLFALMMLAALTAAGLAYCPHLLLRMGSTSF